MVVYTLGHSTLALGDFLALLAAHGITGVADVRRYPASRRHPHFARDALAAALAELDLAYSWLPALGGRRTGHSSSPHVAWQHASFRAYADHMDTAEFHDGLAALLALADARATAIVCAEAVPWRCHRQLIADALAARGIAVRHVLGPVAAKAHRPPPFTRFVGERVVYDGGQLALPASHAIGHNRRARMQKLVQIVSHGPHCLDGVAAAVAVARFHAGQAEVAARFAGNSEIDATLRALAPTPGRDAELWITDISWREPETDAHLRSLVAAGVRIFWIDHHRTALERVRAGKVDVPFADQVLSEEFAASRLTYEYLVRRLAAEGRTTPAFTSLAPLIAMADDNDRWLHRVPGSRELACTVRTLGADAYGELLAIDEQVTYSPRMAEARARVEAEIAHSFAVAEASRTEQRIGTVTLVVAVCDGHPSEIADTWGKKTTNAVFALYDTRSLAVSLRRSPDCEVDLSRVAGALGGGGHAAASGCELPDVRKALAAAVAERVRGVLR